MAKIHDMLTLAGITFNRNSAALAASRKRDEEGIVQAECSSGSYTLVVQGKVKGAGFSWMNLTDPADSKFNLTAGESKVFTGIPILPRMRVQVLNPTSATVSIFLME